MVAWSGAKNSDWASGIHWLRIKRCFSFKENWHSLFERPSSHHAALDGLRALAVLYLLCYHAFHLVFLFSQPDTQLLFLQNLSIWVQPLVLGDRSVDAFFVLSGFLVADMLFRERQLAGRIKVGRFLWRRFLRLSPLYYCLIAVFVVFAAPWVEKRFYLANALYLNNLLPLDHQYIPFTWSLAIEEQFYLFLAVFLAVVFFRVRWRLLALIGLVLASAMVRWLALLEHPQWLVSPELLLVSDSPVRRAFAQSVYTHSLMRVGPLFVGLLLAYLYRYHQQALSVFATTWKGVLPVAIFVAAMVLLNFTPVFGQQWSAQAIAAGLALHRHLFAFAIGCLMLIVLFPTPWFGRLQSVLANKAWIPVARLSFALYLGHLPAMFGLYPVLLKYGILSGDLTLKTVFGLLALALPVCVIGAVIVYCLIEKPFLRLRDVNSLPKR